MKKPNYYREAIKDVPYTILIFTILGFAVSNLFFHSIITLFILLALFSTQLAYILIVPNLPAYKRYINFKMGYQELDSSNSGNLRRKELLDLPFDIRNKAEKLEDKYNQILKQASKNSDLKMMMSKEIEQLSYLIDSYIKFSSSLANYKDYLLNNNPELVEQEISNLKNRIKTCFDGLKKANDLDMAHKRMQKRTLLQNNLVILQKRLEKIKNVKGSLETLQAEIDVVEDTFYLISDHIVTFTPGDTLNIDLNSIINGVENTEKVVRETHKEMEKLKNMSIDKIFE